jgi:hypothetical protein
MKAWRPYAQRLLFRNVRLYDPGNTYGFLEATRPPGDNQQSERLGDCVRTLDITAMSREMMSLIPFVLRHCPKLYELSASFHNNLDVRTLANPPALPAKMKAFSGIAYKQIPLPQIQAMHIDTLFPNSYLSYHLLKLWPNVRHLVLTGHALHEAALPQSGSRQTQIPNLKLYELQIGKIKTHKGPVMNASAIALLLQSSIGTLTMLDLRGLDSTISYLEEIMITHGPHLRSLRLPALNIHIDTPWLVHCTSLEEIVIDSYPPKKVRTYLPKDKIVHASFSSKVGEEFILNPMIDWLETLPCLETFTWVMRKGVSDKYQARDAEDLQQACSRMGVRLRLLAVMTSQVSNTLSLYTGTDIYA